MVEAGGRLPQAIKSMDGAAATDGGDGGPQGPPPPTCRVAIVGANRQRVAKVVAFLRSDGSYHSVATASLLHPSQTDDCATEAHGGLPSSVPPTVDIEYLPCVATFDSYENEEGATVRYLSKLEHHGPNGTLVKGKSLAPFFDEGASSLGGGGGNDVEEVAFPGIACVAIGCGIEADGDVDCVRSFLQTLSASCAAQLSSTNEDGDESEDRGVMIECIKPNAEYASMREENEAYRDMSEDEKKRAAAECSIGPGKMAKFAYETGRAAVRRRWEKEFTEALLSEKVGQLTVESTKDDACPLLVDLSSMEQTDSQMDQSEPAVAKNQEDEMQMKIDVPAVHVPNPEKTRYACKRCRTVLFGVDDLEDPPHAQSMHSFTRKKAGGYVNTSASCQNHFMAQPLSWMDDGCSGMEGKLHCHKCKTKVGHYSWTGAQCSCGTWVTPAIMVPVSKVDEMKPVSQDVIAATGALYVNHHYGLMGT